VEQSLGKPMRLPFSKGNEHWGAAGAARGKAPFHRRWNTLGERKLTAGQSAFLLRSDKSAFALLLTKVTKPRLTPELA